MPQVPCVAARARGIPPIGGIPLPPQHASRRAAHLVTWTHTHTPVPRRGFGRGACVAATLARCVPSCSARATHHGDGVPDAPPFIDDNSPTGGQRGASQMLIVGICTSSGLRIRGERCRARGRRAPCWTARGGCRVDLQRRRVHPPPPFAHRRRASSPTQVVTHAPVPLHAHPAVSVPRELRGRSAPVQTRRCVVR